MRSRTALPLLLASLALVGAGCITVDTGESVSGNGGVYKTGDKGDTWSQRVAIPTTDGEKRTIGGTSVVAITQDPQDPNAIYLGTAEHGMWFSYDGGAAWFQPLQLKRGRINAVAVHPKDKCQVYATAENRIMKSKDCSRTFEAVYLDTRTERVMTSVLVDAFNPNIVWIANDGGDVLKSEDAGASWRPVTNFRSAVRKMLFSADDSRRVYAATAEHGIWRTDDAGANWLELALGYKEFRDSKAFLDMAVGVSDPKVVIFASKHGLIKSSDRGDTWESLNLLTPDSAALVYSVAIDPKDANNIFYGTSTTFYRSPNGGVNWVPKKLPTTRTATALLVDRSNPAVLYMGVTQFNQ
jgi:photosystem II stability/assembly factor-like uncharacterized protein